MPPTGLSPTLGLLIDGPKQIQRTQKLSMGLHSTADQRTANQ